MKNGLLLGTLFLFFSAFSAHAELVVTDWETEGDELIVVDTDTGNKWLNLALTVSESIDDISAKLSTIYTGWRLATEDEVFTLMANHYGWDDKPVGSAPAELRNEWQDAFGSTGSGGRSYGNYIGDNGDVNMAGTRSLNYVYFNYTRGSDSTESNQYDGVFLVSNGPVTLEEKSNLQDVSTPFAAGTLALALMFGSRRFINH